MLWTGRRIALGVLLLLATVAAYAQSNGTVKGILTDPGGGSAPNAAVVLLNKGTAAAYGDKEHRQW